MTRLDEAKEILKAFGFDKGRSNDRSGRTLLALAQMKGDSSWADATNEMLGVRAILDWIRDQLGHEIAENTRETYRRQTLHQFRDAGFVIYNDDDPGRPTNSSANNYRLNPKALEVIRLHGTPAFADAIQEYLAAAPGLLSMYQAARTLTRIPVTLPGGMELSLGGGGQNVLIKQMIDDFCGFFVPGGEVLYIGDADEKLMHFDEQKLASLDVTVDTHGKLPDLVVYQEEKNWLFLMEAASTHGPVDAKRHGELQALFAGSTAGLVYVSCFPDRPTMRKFLADLAWETEAWCASDPTHMIHLNGERFLGPYA
ncbi:BsuBI/PstI family type II restriction endonuclease [Streptomyces spectabilis]|uniref:Restriction endonuclease n=1 Tax=Streptomyces spectabilis TaxID=68270 RepID=A0A516R9P8_STRST|nr:BsuBI/PstI family type II restriction endonuclease [Streptomyces spectabilis]QDQ12373.1 restriction endonuclease [Streptomyces spectabilis]